MKELFTMLQDPRFHLVSDKAERLVQAPDPSFVRLNREGYTVDAGIKKKTKVHPYMHLATHPAPGKGDLFSPIYGEVTDITEGTVFVKRIDPDEALQEACAAVPETDILAAPERGPELVALLKSLGLNTKSLAQNCHTLIINGLNPDPGVTWAESILKVHTDTFLAGMEMLRRISPAKQIYLACAYELRVHFAGVKVVGLESKYPASINSLVIKTVTGEENPKGVGIVSLHGVWSLGHLALTKKPLIDGLITIGSLSHNGNYIVRDGSTVGELLQFANVELQNGDTIVRGGPLRGESVDRLDRSITKGATGLFLVEKGANPPMEGHSPCVSCGACSAICPARLRPDMLSRYVEFGLYKRCEAEYVMSCLECGLCSYVCIARRPVLQYIRLAKSRVRATQQKASLEAYSKEKDAGNVEAK